jgi:SAM-dependent methyltransferase
MFSRTVTPDDLARLKAARDAADRRYNEALTALDAALPEVLALPHPPPGPDEHQITPLNERWRILPDVPPVSGNGLVRRLRGLVWQIVAPIAERQQAFNAALVDHVNRSVPIGRATRESAGATLEFVGDQLRALSAFHSALIVYLQKLTPYVDTKDYEFEALATRRAEDAGVLVDRIDTLDHRAVGLNGAITGLTDELLKRWESAVSREQRFDAKVSGLAAAHAAAAQEFRDSLAVLHQATTALKRELQRRPAEPAAPASLARGPEPAAAAAPETASDTFNAWKYVGFEDRFRGSQEEIRSRLEAYVPLFAGARDVLDVGCGRGEFLDLLRERGVTGRGLDLNHEMVEVCRSRGLEAVEGDALGYLRTLEDGSLGGLLAAQVVEHLEPDYLLQLLEEAFNKLRPGSTIVLETINPACWFAFFSSYIRDITHVRPLHPDTLSYLLTASGFQQVQVRYSAPYPERDKLRKVAGEGLVEEALNANADKLNTLLFTYMDYAAIGTRL